MCGLIAGGAAMLGVLYAISLSAAVINDFNAENGWLAVPVVGPFGWLATRSKSTTSCGVVANGVDSSFSSCESNDEPGNRVLMIIDGLGQVAGSAMLVAGLAITRKQLLRADRQEVIVAPYTSSTGSGLRIFGRF